MLAEFDSKLFYLINKNCSNILFDFLMPCITILGSGEVLFLIALSLIFFSRLCKTKDSRARLLVAGILLLTGLALTYYIVYFLKNWVARPRPFTILPDIRPFITEKSFSFPSAHSAQIFMAVTILSGFFRKRILLFTLAALAGFSRVYIGVHFVSDVIAGAIIGIIIGYSLRILIKDLINV